MEIQVRNDTADEVIKAKAELENTIKARLTWDEFLIQVCTLSLITLDIKKVIGVERIAYNYFVTYCPNCGARIDLRDIKFIWLLSCECGTEFIAWYKPQYITGKRIRKRKHSRDACFLCMGIVGIVEHHINGQKDDDRPENKVFLCTRCHGKIHGLTLKAMWNIKPRHDHKWYLPSHSELEKLREAIKIVRGLRKGGFDLEINNRGKILVKFGGAEVKGKEIKAREEFRIDPSMSVKEILKSLLF